MPYASDKQRKYLHAKKPAVAAKFDQHIRKEGRQPMAKKKKKGKGY